MAYELDQTETLATEIREVENSVGTETGKVAALPNVQIDAGGTSLASEVKVMPAAVQGNGESIMTTMPLNEAIALRSLVDCDDGMHAKARKRLIDSIAAGLGSEGRAVLDGIMLARVGDELSLLDGRMRLEAGQSVGIKTVNAIIREFKTMEEARCLAIQMHAKHRKVNDRIIHLGVKMLWAREAGLAEERRRSGREIDKNEKKGSTAKVVAKLLNTNASKVEKAHAVSGNQELEEKILAGMSINKAYSTLKGTQAKAASRGAKLSPKLMKVLKGAMESLAKGELDNAKERLTECKLEALMPSSISQNN